MSKSIHIAEVIANDGESQPDDSQLLEANAYERLKWALEIVCTDLHLQGLCTTDAIILANLVVANSPRSKRAESGRVLAGGTRTRRNSDSDRVQLWRRVTGT